jgi:hypothetical protein
MYRPFYLFVACLTKLSVAANIKCRVMERLVNNEFERVWKKVALS